MYIYIYSYSDREQAKVITLYTIKLSCRPPVTKQPFWPVNHLIRNALTFISSVVEVHKGTCFVGNFTPWMTTLGVSRWGQKVKPVCLVRVRLEVLISTLSFQNVEKLVFLCTFTQPHTMFVPFTLWISSLFQWFTYFSALCCLQISGTSGPHLLHQFLIRMNSFLFCPIICQVVKKAKQKKKLQCNKFYWFRAPNDQFARDSLATQCYCDKLSESQRTKCYAANTIR